jgi:hypothetical protein
MKENIECLSKPGTATRCRLTGTPPSPYPGSWDDLQFE